MRRLRRNASEVEFLSAGRPVGGVLFSSGTWANQQGVDDVSLRGGQEAADSSFPRTFRALENRLGQQSAMKPMLGRKHARQTLVVRHLDFVAEFERTFEVVGRHILNETIPECADLVLLAPRKKARIGFDALPETGFQHIGFSLLRETAIVP